jgi:valyl-tRNA synthetase
MGGLPRTWGRGRDVMLDKNFNPTETEPRLYAGWESSGAFACDPGSNAAPFTIMIPPPNVTGSLHMGHALTFTVQDALIRYRRMQGRDALWQPGTDHAGIATQMVVERLLAAEGIDRRTWARGVSSSGSGNGRRNPAARSPAVAPARRLAGLAARAVHHGRRAVGGGARGVRHAVREGLIYRDRRLVNWDPEMQTAISDLEVENQEIKGHLWHIRYPIAGEPGRSSRVATTRPETMLGDTAVAVHPEHRRCAADRQARVSAAGRPAIPIVADDLCRSGKGHRRGEDHAGA